MGDCDRRLSNPRRPGEPTVSPWIAEIHFEPRAAGQAQALRRLVIPTRPIPFGT